jgi:hypothetical protein
MTYCRLCGKDDGHHHDHDEYYICSRCYPSISALVEKRLTDLLRLARRKESATADTLRKETHHQ